MQIARMPSPNGASKQSPKIIILHAIAEFIDLDPRDRYAPNYLEDLGISAHAFVTPTGTIIRCREDNQGAYHAKGNNTDSLGIEFMVPGVHTYATFIKAIEKPYLTRVQYKAGAKMVKLWVDKYNIKKIVRHSDLSPSRKTDPGEGFGFDRFLKDIGVNNN